MKYSFGLAALAVAVSALSEDVTTVYVCDSDIVAMTTSISGGVYAEAVATSTASSASATATGTATNTTAVFAPIAAPGLDRHDVAFVVPQTNVSLYYESNTTVPSGISVNNAMKYPTVLLEQIASIVNVDCSADSVAITFNNSDVFASTQAAWTADGTMVFITNHLGDCDPELERGFFLSTSLSFDNTTMVATASSTVANISSTAAETEITFGNLPTTNVTKRSLILDPTYTINKEIGLNANTTLYSYSPYLTVTANEATFTGSATFSGYLKFNWLGLKLKDLYFDIDVAFASALEITAEIDAEYNKTFTYSPASLLYGYSIPGILTIGPELIFSVDAEVYASEKTTLTTKLDVNLADGNVHVNLLDESKTSASGWVPTYGASANISATAEAQLNPTASLTVELALKFFDGLVDLSTGLTAKPGFTNDFILTAAAGVDLTGFANVTSSSTCTNGLAVDSEFTFAVDAFATEWYSKELYSVEVPILKSCFEYNTI